MWSCLPFATAAVLSLSALPICAQSAIDAPDVQVQKLIDRVCGTKKSLEEQAFQSVGEIRREMDCVVEVIWTLRPGVDKNCGPAPANPNTKAYDQFIRCLSIHIADYEKLVKVKPPASVTDALQPLAEDATSVAAMRITATARDNTLQYKYENDTGDTCIAGDVLMIPVDKEISFNITSLDHIYVWSVAGLVINADAIPGRLNSTSMSAATAQDVAGVFANTGNATAPQTRILVRVLSQQDYDVWEKHVLPKSAVPCFSP